VTRQDSQPLVWCLVAHTMASPQAAGPLGPLRPSYRPSVNNTKARTQHVLTARALLHHTDKCDITELTKVERVAPEGAQEAHRQTVAGEPQPQPPTTALPSVDPYLKSILDEQFKKMNGGKGDKERKLYIPSAIILNELALLWYQSQPNPPPFVIIHLANPDNPLPGDTYNTQCHPDFVSKRATIQELEDYLEQLKSPSYKIPNIDDLRPAHGEVVSTVEIKK
jgi:hypothetical protein